MDSTKNDCNLKSYKTFKKGKKNQKVKMECQYEQ